jgi:hypothetical protein
MAFSTIDLQKPEVDFKCLRNKTQEIDYGLQ